MKNVQKQKKTCCPMLPVVVSFFLVTKIPPHMVQNLYSERELSIKLLLGEKTKKKTNISPFPATHTYIKLTFVSFFFNFFILHLSLNRFISPCVLSLDSGIVSGLLVYLVYWFISPLFIFHAFRVFI